MKSLWGPIGTNVESTLITCCLTSQCHMMGVLGKVNRPFFVTCIFVRLVDSSYLLNNIFEQELFAYHCFQMLKIILKIAKTFTEMYVLLYLIQCFIIKIILESGRG